MKITSINEFKKYLAEAHMDFGNNPTGGTTDTTPMSNTVEYWNGYATSDFNKNPTVYNNLEEALEEAIHDWNSEADVPIKALTPETENEIRGYFQAVGSINTEVVAAMITQLGAIDAEDIDSKTENPLLQYGTEEEVKKILFDVKTWYAPDNINADNDNEFWEAAEGTTPGEEGYYWARQLNYISNEDFVYTFTDKIHPNSDFSIDIDGADLGTDVRESEVQNQDSFKPKTQVPETTTQTTAINMEELIPKLISYLGEEYGLTDTAHEGDVALSLENILMPEQGDTEFDNTIAAACKKLEELGWTIEYNDSMNK